jgi:SAM-dependent methyltransferase
VTATRADRERAFWDEAVPSLEDCLAEYVWGRNANVVALLDALEPLAGAEVLDVACGTGLLSAWLAERGAHATGVDVSERAVARAHEVCARLGVEADFRVASATADELGAARFDRLAGRYALHHLDVAEAAPALARLLRPGGSAAFLETVDSNPLLRIARRHLAGRLGVARLGTPEERPLAAEDFRVLAACFEGVRVEVARLSFLQLFDRQVLRYGSRRFSAALARADAAILRLTGWKNLSYHQVVVLGGPRPC